MLNELTDIMRIIILKLEPVWFVVVRLHRAIDSGRFRPG